MEGQGDPPDRDRGSTSTARTPTSQQTPPEDTDPERAMLQPESGTPEAQAGAAEMEAETAAMMLPPRNPTPPQPLSRLQLPAPVATAAAAATTTTATTAVTTSATAAPALALPPIRPLHERPCYKLSTSLLATYKRINNVYFERSRMNQQGTIYNQGYDDEHGNYLVVEGEEVNGRYLVQSMLGKGSFGIVVKVFDTLTREYVALKIVKNKKVFTQQAQIEINLLLHMHRVAKDSDNIVRIISDFSWHGHTVIAMELCFLNLFELLRLTEMTGVPLQPVACLCCELLHTLAFLEREEIIHCDMKPENILLRSSGSSRIKVIDFGSACNRGRTMYNYIQTRFYRAPEVILGMCAALE